MTGVITKAEQATSEWLTEVLRREGVLGAGRVMEVAGRTELGLTSEYTHLELVFSEDVPPPAPHRLFLKVPRDFDWARETNRDEVNFYNHVLRSHSDLPEVVRCYDATYDETSDMSHLLLDDLSQTHITPLKVEELYSTDRLPTQTQLEQIIDCLAGFHAYFWDSPVLQNVPVHTAYANEAAFNDLIARRTRQLDSFEQSVGVQVGPERVALYRDILAKYARIWPHLAERMTDGKNLTITHGDCSFNQFLCPRDPQQGHTYIVDFQNYSICFAGEDLGRMLPTFWSRAQRQENGREEKLLRRYHNFLVQSGVTDYSQQNLWDDYRLTIIYMLFEAIWTQTDGAAEAYWTKKLNCLTEAYHDLNCAALLT